MSNHPESVDFDAVGTEERTLPPPTALEVLVTELVGAVPEVRDALLSAVDSLLDAARALIDAADRVVCGGDAGAEARAEQPADEPGGGGDEQ